MGWCFFYFTSSDWSQTFSLTLPWPITGVDTLPTIIPKKFPTVQLDKLWVCLRFCFFPPFMFTKLCLNLTFCLNFYRVCPHRIISSFLILFFILLIMFKSARLSVGQGGLGLPLEQTLYSLHRAHLYVWAFQLPCKA